MKYFVPFLFLLFWSEFIAAQQVVINEFMASNKIAVADPAGEFDDWIELFNPSSEAVNLSGWHLSDNAQEPDKWTFPDTALAAGNFLIIWADDDEEQGGNHACFKLSVSGEEIILSDANLNPVDQVVFGPQIADVSCGRFPNGNGEFILMNPSFATENVDDYTPGSDPSGLLFDQDVIYRFDLHFYIENWQDSLLQNYYNDQQYLPAQLTFNDTLVLDSIGVRYKGASSFVQSSATPKKPLKMRFDKYIDDQLLAGISRLNFSNCVKDPTFMREVIAYQIVSDYVPAPRTAYADILVDGELLGFYVQVEQIDEFFLTRHFPGGIGNLYKASDNGATMLYRGENPADYEAEFELKTNETANDWSDLITLLDNLNNCSNAAFVSTMENFLDLNECAAILAFNMTLSHFDSYTGSGRNFYLYHDPVSDRFKYLPWDLNETFGCYNNNWNVITQDVLNISNLSERPLNRRFLADPSLRKSYLNYLDGFINGAASTDSISANIERRRDFIAPHVLADPNKLYSYQDFLENLENDIFINLGQIIPGLMSFSEARNADILQQLTTVSVYPGDCDNNGIVDEFDILPIGIYFLQSGAQRNETSFLWQAHSARSWEVPAATFADANGDGEVNELDVIGVGVNWGNTHSSLGLSYPVDPDNFDLLESHRSIFQIIYNSLPDGGVESLRIKSLLTSIFGFSGENSASPILLSNHPNPFNPSTTISFSLTTEGTENTELVIYNIKGQKVKTLIAAELSSGKVSCTWNGKNDAGKRVASGEYIVKLNVNGEEKAVRKIILLR